MPQRVVYYSYTGNCESIVTELTNRISADVVEIEPSEKGLHYEANNYALGTQINVVIGSNTFTATLADSETGEAFAALLPLTVTMNELNGNEKYHYLSFSLPTAAYQPGTIHVGDLMLYGNNCVVLFYETFNSSYSYTRLGAIDDHSGLAAALGSGNVSVRFESSSTTTENLTPNVQSDDVQSTKVLRDGQFYINRNGATYNVQGVKVNAE